MAIIVIEEMKSELDLAAQVLTTQGEPPAAEITDAVTEFREAVRLAKEASAAARTAREKLQEAQATHAKACDRVNQAKSRLLNLACGRIDFCEE